MEGAPDDPLAPLSDRVGEFDPMLETAETRVALQNAMDTLPHRLREILRRRYLEGATQSRVGRAMGLSQMQVCRLERQALNLLREKLSGAPPPPDCRAWGECVGL